MKVIKPILLGLLLLMCLVLVIHRRSLSSGDINMACMADDTQLALRLLKSNNGCARETTDYGYTPLHWTAMSGNIELARELIKAGANVNAYAKGYYTPLHIAAREGHSSIVALLVKSKADVNVVEDDGKTPLHLACEQASGECARAILSTPRVDIDLVDNDGHTPLHLAALAGNIGAVKLLVSHGAYVNAKDERGTTPLHQACSKSPDCAKYLISEGADVQAANSLGYTPLHWAASHGDWRAVQLLLKHKASVNAKTSEGNTPLHEAAQCCCRAKCGHLKIVELLLDAGADPDARNKKNDTPESLASECGCADLGRLLRRASHRESDIFLDAAQGNLSALKARLSRNPALVNARDKQGYTVLHVAVRGGDMGCVRLLLDLGADVNALDSNKQPPIEGTLWPDSTELAELLIEHGALGANGSRSRMAKRLLNWAGSVGSVRVMGLFLERGVSVDCRDDVNEIPLRTAVIAGEPDAAKLLLEHGADPNVADLHGGETCLWYAVSTADSQALKICQSLIRHGAKVNARTSSGATALHRAVVDVRPGVVDYLLSHGADVNARDNSGETPLDDAKDPRTIRSLLLHGAVMSSSDE